MHALTFRFKWIAKSNGPHGANKNRTSVPLACNKRWPPANGAFHWIKLQPPAPKNNILWHNNPPPPVKKLKLFLKHINFSLSLVINISIDEWNILRHNVKQQTTIRPNQFWFCFWMTLVNIFNFSLLFLSIADVHCTCSFTILKYR